MSPQCVLASILLLRKDEIICVLVKPLEGLRNKLVNWEISGRRARGSIHELINVSAMTFGNTAHTSLKSSTLSQFCATCLPICLSCAAFLLIL